MPFASPEKRREYHLKYQPQYDEANADKVRQRKALWYLKNKERLAAKWREERRSAAGQKAAQVIQSITLPDTHES